MGVMLIRVCGLEANTFKKKKVVLSLVHVRLVMLCGQVFTNKLLEVYVHLLNCVKLVFLNVF